MPGILISRVPHATPSARSMAAHRSGRSTLRTIKSIVALESEGTVVHTVSMDVSDETAVRTFAENWELECRPPVRAASVHAAGTLLHRPIVEMLQTDLEAVLRPKLGAWFLHRALACMPLDFFVLFSSASSVLSSARLGAYGAANAFLDGLAAYRNERGKPCLSINWGMWTEAGMSTRFDASEIQALSEHGMGGLHTSQGLECLGGLIRSQGQAAVLPIEWRKWAARYPSYAASPLLSGLLDGAAAPAKTRDGSARQRILDGPMEGRRQALLSYLTESLENILEFPAGAINPSTPLSQLGVDSLMGLEFKHRIDRDLGVSLAHSSRSRRSPA